MTTVQERPVAVRRPQRAIVPPVRRVPDEPRRARCLALTELMGRRRDLHGVYDPATVAADAILWSV